MPALRLHVGEKKSWLGLKIQLGHGGGEKEEKKRAEMETYVDSMVGHGEWKGDKSLRHPVFPGGHPSKY